MLDHGSDKRIRSEGIDKGTRARKMTTLLVGIAVGTETRGAAIQAEACSNISEAALIVVSTAVLVMAIVKALASNNKGIRRRWDPSTISRSDDAHNHECPGGKYLSECKMLRNIGTNGRSHSHIDCWNI